jgi:hypothetical protein
LSPRIVIPHQDDFGQKPFAEIHFYTDPSIHADVVVFISGHLKWNLPKALPMERREDKPQICKGRFGSLTQTGDEDNESFKGSKEGDQGFIHKPELP